MGSAGPSACISEADPPTQAGFRPNSPRPSLGSGQCPKPVDPGPRAGTVARGGPCLVPERRSKSGDSEMRKRRGKKACVVESVGSLPQRLFTPPGPVKLSSEATAEARRKLGRDVDIGSGKCFLTPCPVTTYTSDALWCGPGSLRRGCTQL